ncbi:hypothetical protein EXW39_16630 [Bacillus mycoides]|uniref:HNH endonuclease n=1 Tax=Bacillus TaxID=1386 RepID=UPI001C020256|nr:HNH endonuclease [Bacillus mycoides]QWH61693.1 hypothetical protein EXW39_16630 [Bacillus mycoides]
MIKINKLNCPNELTFERQKELTFKYLKDGESVWKQTFIENSLLESSHTKCIYCECKLNVESKYMEVEHFHDKKRYPLEVVNWENLLPSCKRCNVKKSTFDTKLKPFIHPAKMDPRVHLVLSDFRLWPVTQAGDNTIKTLLLNDPIKLVQQRFQIVNTVSSTLADIHDNVQDYFNNTRRTSQNRNKFMSAIDNLLLEAMPSASYSATVATAIINNPHFLSIVDILNLEDLWDNDLQKKFNVISDLSLETDLKKTMAYKKKEGAFQPISR